MFGHVTKRHQQRSGKVCLSPLLSPCASGAWGCALGVRRDRQQDSTAGPAGRGAAMPRRGLRGMYISRRALRQQFDPRTYPKETYLLCELQWGGRGRFWIHWARNDEITDCHVEHYFLEQIFEPRSSNVCEITWYQSWSPCASCCDIIQEFLEEQHNVYIDIRVARVYNEHIRENRAALRQLASLPGATIRAMDVEDYRHCWDTFLQRGGYFDFTAGSFRSAVERTRLKLEDILGNFHF